MLTKYDRLNATIYPQMSRDDIYTYAKLDTRRIRRPSSFNSRGISRTIAQPFLTTPTFAAYNEI